ncbi:response regulator [Paenibacillus sp. YN15]|uniref:response regulator n=1 Tax=Paenibacillus sp. YN15 TaxID=1742774 RepID=UPI000DCECC7F|nr:response regulator [Paenibacillus sp. YN15]RAU97311.1 hypothetical protein DQG13_18930 [Paenibacillus sp. YN15]
MKATVLIVDDEPVIRKGLSTLVESNDLGWVVIGEAANGQEAIRQLGLLQPQLVLTDIRMPLMDGLEVARYVSEHMPQTAIVILTGYRDFEYAQAAIRYGVREFLLKPCEEEEICRVLRQAHSQFRQLAEQREKEARLLQIQEEQLLRAMVLRLPHDKAEARIIERRLAGYEFWLMVMDSYMPQERNYRAQDLPLLQFAVGNIVQELLNSRMKGHRWFPLEYNEFAFFLERHPDNQPSMSEIARVVKDILGLDSHVHMLGRLDACGDAEELYQSHDRESRDASAKLRPGHPERRFDEERAEAIRNEIVSLLHLGRQDELQSYLAKLADAVRRGSDAVEEHKVNALCAAVALHEVMVKELEWAGNPAAGEMGIRISQLGGIQQHDEIDSWLAVQLEQFGTAFRTWLDGRNGSSVDQALRFIEENYMRDCTLSAAAVHVHLTANYLGNLFKKAKGESFNAYVTRCRLQKAKLLLANTDMKIIEVAEAVGYGDSNYFTTAFRQSTGLSPTEYRKLHAINAIK